MATSDIMGFLFCTPSSLLFFSCEPSQNSFIHSILTWTEGAGVTSVMCMCSLKLCNQLMFQSKTRLVFVDTLTGLRVNPFDTMVPTFGSV